MGERFHASVRRLDGETRVRLAGVIDEDEELGSVLDQIQRGRVEIDLGDIERINSLGVRQWIHWISEVERRGGVPVLARCSRAIVSQVNLIHNFTGASGAIHSFFAPYFCERCDREQQLLLDVSDMGEPPHRAPRIRCDSCDQLMEFDDIEDGYFAFLGRQPPPPLRRRTEGTFPPPTRAASVPAVRSEGTPPGQPGLESAAALSPSSPFSPALPARERPALQSVPVEPAHAEPSPAMVDELVPTARKQRYEAAELAGDVGADAMARGPDLRALRRTLMGLAAAFLVIAVVAAVLLAR